MLGMKLMSSLAERAKYIFTNSAQQTHINKGRDVGFYGKRTTEKGVHMSFDVVNGEGKKVNLFLTTEDALKMWVHMRDSLRHTIEMSSDAEKRSFAVFVERDAWGLERILGRKSHIAEDLGL